MENFFKYLPVSDVDKQWGMHILNAGYYRSEVAQAYPPVNHPSHHNFKWENGRIFNEFQVLYIANGKGVFESKSRPLSEVHEGTVIFLFPNEWHRYKPDENTGWSEFWVGFDGIFAHHLANSNFISQETALVHIGLQEAVIDLFTKIIELTKTERPGYQPQVSGMLMHLLGEVFSLYKQRELEVENISEFVISKARLIIRENINNKIQMEKVAEDLNVSYSWFRKAFKAYTGLAPNQYLIQLKIDKAKTMLQDANLSSKQIAYELGLDSAFYFSKIFKIKTGYSPEAYRRKFYK